jgi:hypothetical protein
MKVTSPSPTRLTNYLQSGGEELTNARWHILLVERPLRPKVLFLVERPLRPKVFLHSAHLVQMRHFDVLRAPSQTRKQHSFFLCHFTLGKQHSFSAASASTLLSWITRCVGDDQHS